MELGVENPSEESVTAGDDVPHRTVCAVCRDTRYLFDAPAQDGDVVRFGGVEREWTCIYCWPIPKSAATTRVVERHCTKCGVSRFHGIRQRKDDEKLTLISFDVAEIPAWVDRWVISLIEAVVEEEVCAKCR